MDKDPKKTEKKNSPMFKKKVVKKVKNEFASAIGSMAQEWIERR